MNEPHRLGGGAGSTAMEPWGVRVELEHAFGSQCSTATRDSVFFGDDAGRHLVFVVGRKVAFQSVDTGEMNFVELAEDVEHVSAMCISKDRGLLAICEQRGEDKGSWFTVFNLKDVGVKPVQAVDCGLGSDGKLVCVAFSADSKYVCVVSSKPERAKIWDWQGNKCICEYSQMSQPVTRASFCPWDSHQLAFSGERCLRLFRRKDSNLKPFPEFSGLAESKFMFTDHAMMQPPERSMVVTTLEGPVFILDCDELIVSRVIDAPFVGQNVNAFTVRCFSQGTGGFLLGGSLGMISLWERAADSAESGAASDEYTVHTLFAGRRAHVTNLDICDSEESVVLGFQNSDIGTLSMSSIFVQREAKDLTANIISSGFHCGSVSSLDVAVQRPVAVTCCAEDCTVRIWNFAANTCEVGSTFLGDHPLSVALHPFGYLLGVGFQDKLRFFHVLSDEFRLLREFPTRAAKMLRFSNGGHLIAAAHGKIVSIFASHSWTRVATLRQHSGTVTSICFDSRDGQLATCGSDGCVYVWSCTTWQRVGERVSRNTEYSVAAFAPCGSLVCGGVEGHRSFLRRFQCIDQGVSGLTMEACDDIELQRGVELRSLVHVGDAGSSYTLLAGTSTGSVCVYPYPLNQSAYDEYGLHIGDCGHLSVSADGRTVISGGGDGSVFILHLKGVRQAETEAMGEDTTRTADVVLINRADMMVQGERVQLLEAENKNLQSELERKIAHLHNEYKITMQEKREQDQREIQELRRRFEALQAASTQKERESLRIIKSLESSHISAADQLEGLYERKISYEADRYVALQSDLAEVQRAKERVEEKLRSEFNAERQKLLEAQQKLQANHQKELDAMRNQLKFNLEHFHETLDTTETTCDTQMEQIRVSGSVKLKSQESLVTQLRKEQDSLLRGLDLMEKEKEKISKEQNDAQGKIESLGNKVEELKRTVNGLRVERKERDSTLAEKEKKISELKLKVSTLKKFKHVLDFRLREVSESLQPKERQIAQLKSQLHELETEFERQLAEQRAMEGSLETKNQNIARLNNEMKRLQDTVKGRDRLIEQFSSDLLKIVDNPDVREWPQFVKQMYHKYVLAGTGPRASDKEEQAMEELDRQMKLMEKKIRSLALKGGRTELACKMDIQKKAIQNSELIVELNVLRTEKKNLNRRVDELELKLKHYNAVGAGGDVMQAAGAGARAALAKRPRTAQPQQLKKGPTVSTPAQDRERLNQILLQLQLAQEQIQMQKMEIRMLRDGLSKEQRQGSQDDSMEAKPMGMHLQDV